MLVDSRDDPIDGYRFMYRVGAVVLGAWSIIYRLAAAYLSCRKPHQ
jgi:hypothetical protein